MALSQGRDSTIAVVGDGFGSLIVFDGDLPRLLAEGGHGLRTERQSCRHLPAVRVQPRPDRAALGVRVSLPARRLADIRAHERLRAPQPRVLFRSIRRKYNPGVPEILTQAGIVAQRTNWEHARYAHRVGWVQREGGENPHFVLYDEDANFIGRSRHVMLAPGHGPLSFPPVLAKARNDPSIADRIVQSYEPKEYAAGGRYVIIGSGIASVNEWANAIDAGAKVLALQRNPTPDEQDLNVPRCLFEARGIDVFERLSFEQRIDFLGTVLRGTAPKRREWLGRIERGRARAASTPSSARSTTWSRAAPACVCTSATATARIRAGST